MADISKTAAGPSQLSGATQQGSQMGLFPGFPMVPTSLPPYPYFMNPMGLNPAFPQPSLVQMPGQTGLPQQLNLQAAQLNPMMMQVPQFHPYGTTLSHPRILHDAYWILGPELCASWRQYGCATKPS